MKNNNIPEYLLCPTPEEARLVLEKIERESDLRWSSGYKPTGYSSHKHLNRYCPELVLSINKHGITYGSKSYYTKEYSVTNFTPASEYLGRDSDYEPEPELIKQMKKCLPPIISRLGKTYYHDWDENGKLTITELKDFNNKNMTKTWETLSAGDYLIDSYGNEFEVLATCGKLIFIYVHHNAHTANHGLTKEHLIGAGYKIKGASEEKPSIDDVIEKLDEASTIKTPIWISGKLYEAIEMLKKLK